MIRQRAQRAGTPREVTLRSLVWTVFFPSIVFGVGQGAAAPVIALSARELGASVALAGLMVALWGLGQVIGDLPAGSLVARIGERRSIMVATLLGATGAGLAFFSPWLWLLAAGLLLTGLANSVWGLARQSYLAEAIPQDRRARAMSLFGATLRVGAFVGPVIGSGVILLVGTRGGLLVQMIAVVVAGLLMIRLPDPQRRRAAGDARISVFGVIGQHRVLLSTLGAGAVLTGAARASRDAVLPLWGEHLGLAAATISLVFAAGSLIDVLLAYPAGYLMDRKGRLAVAVPSLSLMALAYVSMPLAGGLTGLVLVTVLLGLGNGLGSGVIMTLGADTAPPGQRAEFLAAWRLTHDVGWMAGPLTIAGVAAVAPLFAAPLTLGVLAALGAGTLARYIPKYVHRTGELVSPAAFPSPHRPRHDTPANS